MYIPTWFCQMLIFLTLDFRNLHDENLEDRINKGVLVMLHNHKP